jgi:hypothetical protein
MDLLSSLLEAVYVLFNHVTHFVVTKYSNTKSTRNEIKSNMNTKLVLRTLEQHEHRYSQNVPTEIEKTCKEKVRTILENALNKSFPGCKLNAYGSSANELCFSGSDIDMCLCLGDTPPELSDLSERFPKLIDKEEESKTNETSATDPLRDPANSEAVFKKLLEAEYKSSKCFYCRETGHTARDCPKRKADMDKRTKKDEEDEEEKKEEEKEGEEEVSEMLRFAKVHFNHWRNWLRREHVRDNEKGDDPKEYSEELLTKFRESQIEFAKERSLKRHVVVCSALDLCKTFNKPSPLDDDATVDESKKLDVNIEDISVLISARVPILKITGVTLSEGTF